MSIAQTMSCFGVIGSPRRRFALGYVESFGADIEDGGRSGRRRRELVHRLDSIVWLFLSHGVRRRRPVRTMSCSYRQHRVSRR
jgi:hypothetical protein